MYGQNVEYAGINLFCYGSPDYTDDQWRKAWLKLIRRIAEDVEKGSV